MTSIAALLGFKTFQSAIRDLVEVGFARRKELQAGLGRNYLDDDDYDERDDQWYQARRAYQTTYAIAVREGRDRVLEDLREGLPAISDDDFQKLESLLTFDPTSVERVEVSHLRDRFLPILESQRATVDLRLLHLDEGARLAPVVTMRMTFDEALSQGAESVVFQVPIEMLASIEQTIREVRQDFKLLPSLVLPSSVPDWAITEGPSTSPGGETDHE